MPTVSLKVGAGERELWVVAASGEGCSLSEWLRRAAAARLDVGSGVGGRPGLLVDAGLGKPSAAERIAEARRLLEH